MTELGRFTKLVARVLSEVGGVFRDRGLFIQECVTLGVESLPLVLIVGLFTGAVSGWQGHYQMEGYLPFEFIGPGTFKAVMLELGPVLTALVIAGRVSASIAAELGTMKVTEQIDALESLATDPIRYLVVPRLVAAFFMLGILTVYADFVGMFGGYLIAVFKLGVSSDQYIWRAVTVLKMKDVMTGLVKSLWFGAIISTVGCYFGFRTEGGAEGVGRATTLSVVTSLILIIAFDCLFTAIFYFAT